MAKNSEAQSLLYVRQDLGVGRPLVLLHGMFGDGTQWRTVASRLSKYYRVIVVDLLGHGLSPRPEGAKYTAAEHSKVLRKTLERLDATDGTTVVGYSMGGTVALRYAADYDDLSQLYLISTPFYLKPEEMVESGYANSLFYTKLSLALFQLVEKRLKRGTLLYKLVGNENMMQWLHVLIDAYDNKLDPDILRMNLKELINEFPFAANLKKVRAPITFYAGKRDVFVVQAQLRALKKIQPLMEIETLGLVKNDHAVVQYLPTQIVSFLKRYHQQELNIQNDLGSGKPLVLLHGIESSATYWSNIVPALAQNRRVITIDLLGFGKSPKPLNIAYSLDDQVAWLKRTLKNKGITSFDIAGHSLGALVALSYAATYPDEVGELTLVSPVFIDVSDTSNRFILKRLHFIEYFSDTSYLVSSLSKMVGSSRIRKFIPTIRTVTNSIKAQDSIRIARKVQTKKVRLIYGTKDPFIDRLQLNKVVAALGNHEAVVIKGGSHNIPLSDPQVFLSAFEPDLQPKKGLKSSKVQPGQFMRQLLKLASPILLLKASLYSVIGLLLFTQYKAETLVAIVASMVIYQSIQFIRGSFSLKNEGLSYIGYFAVGVLSAIFGIVLIRSFDVTVRIALFILCGYVLINGLSRLLAGYCWTTNKSLKKSQLLSGSLLVLVSIMAFLGSSLSVKVIIYTLAVAAILRGVMIFSYLTGAFFVAYIRGY